MTKGPSKHLTWKEMACKDGTPYPTEWRVTRAIELAEIFEVIRMSFGSKPIIILSAYRTPSWNKKIGGARNSQHLEGRALDISPPDGVTASEFYKVIKEMAPSLHIHGLGKYKTFVHIDTRPTTGIAYWAGTGAKDSRT
jgi:uncharacterized protein YcbK (DUF882 family)